MNKNKANHVFTPSSPAILTFIERNASVNNELVDAINTVGMQIILYGHSGSGKSTLLINKLGQLYENWITTRCMSGMTIDQVILDAFDQLDKFYSSEKSIASTTKISSEISSSFALMKQSISADLSYSKEEKKVRVVPVQLTPNRLATFIGSVSACWVIEDFHKIEKSEKVRFSQIMKVFMDSAVDFPELKIIAIGAVGTAREVVKYDPEMRNRVAEIFVPLMSENEIVNIMNRGEELLNIKIKKGVKDKIVRFSSGLGSVCHQLCLNICFLKRIVETLDEKVIFSERDLSDAVEKYVKSNSDTLKMDFDRALKVSRTGSYENTKEILRAMLVLGKEELTHHEILKKIRDEFPSYPAGNVTTYLKKLQAPERGGVVVYDSNSGKYSFANPFIKAYAHCVFNPQNIVSNERNVDFDSLFEAILKIGLNLGKKNVK